jgi:phytanoyl-CoA hydroxylase
MIRRLLEANTSGPASGERLWIDDQATFASRLDAIPDLRLKALAKSFQEDGFVVLSGVVNDSLIDDAKRAYEEWCAQADRAQLSSRSDGRNPRIVNLHNARDEIARLLTASQAVLDVADMLLGYRTSIYTSLTFQYGTGQPFHRDTPVFRTEPEEFYLGIWFALEDANHENGELRALKGGHRGGRVDPYEFALERLPDISQLDPGGDPLWIPYQDAVTAVCLKEGRQVVQIPAKCGDVVIWHPQLPHSGSPIANKDKTRMSVVFHVVPEGVPVYQADVFFNASKPAPRKSSFAYREFEGRHFVVNDTVVGTH